MVYRIFKIWAQLAFSLYFRRIFISGIEQIPKKGAVLILVNHPNSFLEPCVIAAFQHRNLHFLVRGDMFEKKWLLPILKSTNQIPIYRFKDGFEKLRSNKSTFDQAYKVLAKQHTLMMFPEASSEMVKYLRPLQKGAARLALGSFENNNLDELIIVPAGIHYYDATKSRNDVILKFGEAISMKSWLAMNANQEDKINALTAFLQGKMNQVVVSIAHQDLQSIYDKAYTMAENDQLPYKSSGLQNTEEGYTFIRTLFTKLNQLSGDSLSTLNSKITTYQGTFNNLKSLDCSLIFNLIDKLKIIFFLIVFFILGLPGFILYAPSLVFSKQYIRKKIKHNTFYAPVRIAVNMATHLVCTILFFFVFEIFFKWSETLLIVSYLQISLFSFAIFIDFSRYSSYLFNLSVFNKKKELLDLRNEIFSLMNGL